MEQSRQICLAHRKRQVAQIITVHCQHIEGAELNFIVVLAGMQRVEIGDAIGAQDHRLAIEHAAKRANAQVVERLNALAILLAIWLASSAAAFN